MTERLKENETLKGHLQQTSSQLQSLQTQNLKSETSTHKLELDIEARDSELHLLKAHLEDLETKLDRLQFDYDSKTKELQMIWSEIYDKDSKLRYVKDLESQL